MVKLNFKKTGQSGKPVLMILHGLLGSLDNWQTLSNRFKAHFEVYIIDQRNHGKSPHTDSHTYEEMADDLHELIRDEGLEKVFLIGHSMGGKTVAAFIAKYPELVEKAISVDMATKAYPSGHEAIFEALQKLNPNEINSRKEADEELSKHINSFPIRQFLLKNLDRKDDGTYGWKMNLEVLVKDYDEILKAIECDSTVETPFLFVKSENSGYINDNDLAEIKKCFPKAELKEVKNTGHWIHAEKPDELYELVIDFFL